MLNRVIKQTETSYKGLAAIPQNPIYQGAWDPGTSKGQAKHTSPLVALLGDVSCSLSTCTKILHLTPFPPASLAPLKGDRLLHKGPWVFSVLHSVPHLPSCANANSPFLIWLEDYWLPKCMLPSGTGYQALSEKVRLSSLIQKWSLHPVLSFPLCFCFLS